ncbi:nucleoside phosphorylase [Bacillus andreraoultii]|uniref:nucleoside phosphorylase n=1 Tax=Bacillus andreraoultii TaxID=1499685 RepID=UPI00053B97D9|nr:nucleoside phosphorylase [Bacillus andreraoultii]
MGTVQPHIQLDDHLNVQYAILPGDPKRVEKVMKYLDSPKEVAFNREYRSAIGYYKGTKVLVMSTGIGGPSMGIAVEELKKIGVSTLIRIGSCGALQSHLPIGSLVIATGAVRNDGTSLTYIEKGYPAVADLDLLIQLKEIAKQLNLSHHFGLVRSHDSFYTDSEEEIDQFWGKRNILASDMETATLFVLAGLRDMKAVSILNVVVSSTGDLSEGINDYVDGESLSEQGERNEILLALETLSAYEQNN